MSARGGIGGIVLIGCVLYFTPAGSWVMRQMASLDSNCYSALNRVGASVANPVCGAVAHGVSGISHFSEYVNDAVGGIRQRVAGGANFDPLNAFTRDMREKMASLASSSDTLSAMMSSGTYGGNASVGTGQLQQAIDSFTIGQSYLKNRTTASLALPWLQQGARQPQGFGLMSQLALGNAYAHGDQGITANPQLAEGYLRQAKESLAMLSSNRSPQAQQLLGALPASPQAIQQHIDTAIAKLNIN